MDNNTLPKEKSVTMNSMEIEEVQNIKAYMQKLYTIWNEFGIEEGQMIERGKAVWNHIQDLLQEIIKEEQVFIDNIKERIVNYTKRIEELSQMLSVTPKEDKSTSLIKKEESLRQEVDNLTKLKHKRMKAYHDLRRKEAEYCSLLGIREHQLSSFTGVPSNDDLLEIEQHIHMLKEERDRRHKKLCLVKKELTTILEVTEFTPETPFEKEILSGSDNVSLTNETLKALEEVVCRVQKKKAELEVQKKALVEKLTSLWDRLKVPDTMKVEFLSNHMDCKLSTLKSIQAELEKCEKIKRENTKMFVDSLREELKQLWEMCHASKAERSAFSLYHAKEMNDTILEEHEKEVEKWKKYYEDVHPIVCKINKRNKLWELLLVFENKATDPNRFKNRRGNLLQEEKERKKLQKDLPALENDIFHDIEIYEAQRGKAFMYYGEDYRNFVTNQWQQRIDQKENEKQERHKQRLMQTENEAIQGTPAKRPLATPKSAPSKLFKSNAGMSVYRTPLPNKSKVVPSTVGRSVLTPSKIMNSLKKSTVNCKLFPSTLSRPNVMKKKDQNRVLKERNQRKEVGTDSENTTTYSRFADELNATSRQSLRSSVLSTKKAGGTRISQNSSKNKRKSVSKSLRRSMRNVSKTTTNLTPARGKLGLPFLI